jgi:flotillin
MYLVDHKGMTLLNKLFSNQCGLTFGRLLQYMMLQDNTFEKLAKANATAITGLQPKITVWNTGEGSGSSNDGTGAIRNIMQSLPPLLSTINEQTGIAPPSWLAQMGSNQSQALSKAKGKGTTTNGEVNGH